MTSRQAWQRSILDAAGNVQTGVQITVHEQDGTTLATVYGSLTGSDVLANPFNTGVQPLAKFYAEAGRYVITAFKSGVGTQTWSDVDLSGQSVRDDLDSRTLPAEISRRTVLSDFVQNVHRIWDIYGQTTKTLPEVWTITRAGDATYNSPNGIKTAPANTARIEYDPVTGECRGLLCEATRTRLNIISAVVTAPEVVTVTATIHTLSFYGSGSLSLTGAFVGTMAGAAGVRTVLTFTPTAGALTITPSGSVTDMQLEATNGATSIIRGELGTPVARNLAQHVRTIGDQFNKAGSTVVIDFAVDAHNNVDGIFGVSSTNTNALTLRVVNSTKQVQLVSYVGSFAVLIASANNVAAVGSKVRAALTFNAAGLMGFAVNGGPMGEAFGVGSDASPLNPAIWTQYFLGALRTPTDNPVPRATIQIAQIIPRWSSQAELTALSIR